MKKIIFWLIFITIAINAINAQNDTSLVVDKIIARVGDKIILLSDLEAQYMEYLSRGKSASRDLKCSILEELLIQKLLLNQADLDSIYVSDAELDAEVEARVNIFVEQMGGVAALENYLNKSIFEIKNDLKDVLADQIRAQRVKDNITSNVNITPSEVSEYYNTLPKDSLPLVDAQIELQQIVFKPHLNKNEEKMTLDKILEIREKIVTGQRKFESMARMYSEDEASARKGGDLGYLNRSELVPEFATAAFALKKGEVSDVVKTKYGYHIIQLIDRKGERVHVRHILIKPMIPPEAIAKTLELADSVRELILKDSITFEKAAEIYSDDENTKNNGGLTYNPMTGSARFTINELPSNIKFDIKDLNTAEVSQPISTRDETGNIVVKLYKIRYKKEPHIANLQNDYQLIMNMALNHKKQKVFDDWIKKQQKDMYISIDPNFKNCNFKFKGWIK